MFAYCGNNPTNNTDPTGHAFWDCNQVAIKDGAYGSYTLSTTGDKESELLNMHLSSLARDAIQPIYRKAMCVKCEEKYVYSEEAADNDDIFNIFRDEAGMMAFTGLYNYSPLSLYISTGWIAPAAMVAGIFVVVTTDHGIGPGEYDMYKVVTIEAFSNKPWKKEITSTYYIYDKNANRFVHLRTEVIQN